MRRTIMGAAAAALTTTALLAPGALASDHKATLKAKLSGGQEVPRTGDRNGRGSATIRLDADRRRVCFTITMQRIDGAAAAHIHRGARGVAGDVVVPLFGTESDRRQRKGCVRNLDEDLVRDIMERPARFYVNVHNADHPNGAIRGQLRK